MRLDTTFKPQDKRTLAIVLYIAVAVLFCWYAIRPAAMKFIELDDKIKSAEVIKQEYKMKTLQLGTAEALYNKAVKDITDSTKTFYDVMDNSQIEKMGTSYVLGFGLTPVDFTVDIRDGSFVNEEPYVFADVKKVTGPVATNDTAEKKPDLKDATSITALDVKSLQAYYNQAVVGVTTTEPSEVECAKVSIVMQGTQEKLQEMIDDITKKSSIRVTGYSWTDAKEIWNTDEKGNKTLINAGYKELRLDLYFYMTTKPDFNK